MKERVKKADEWVPVKYREPVRDKESNKKARRPSNLYEAARNDFRDKLSLAVQTLMESTSMDSIKEEVAIKIVGEGDEGTYKVIKFVHHIQTKLLYRYSDLVQIGSNYTRDTQNYTVSLRHCVSRLEHLTYSSEINSAITAIGHRTASQASKHQQVIRLQVQ